MTADRFVFQRACVEKVAGRVLNAGCKEDPARLQLHFPGRVTNMDLRDYDDAIFHETGQKVGIPVDVQHDMLHFPWPFADDEFDLIVLGDILEDLPDDGCQVLILKEAHRISKNLCITTPEDTPERDWHHLTTITEEKLKVWLEITGWQREEFTTVNYGFVPRGYFVRARRAVSTPDVVK